MFWGKKTVIAIGGGKGGVGKSTIAANLGVTMARTGRNVVVVDADIGAANLHTILGIRYPDKTLDDFLERREPSLENTLIATSSPGLKLLSSASDVLGIASPNYAQRQRLFRAIAQLDTDAIIFDVAAGTHQRATDFFSLAPIGIMVVEPVPTSLENAFSFVKNLLMRALMRKFYRDQEMVSFIESSMDKHAVGKTLQFGELLTTLQKKKPEKIAEFKQQYLNGNFTVYILANAITSPSQNAVAENFCRIIRQYLLFNAQVLGVLPYEPAMDAALIERIPFVQKYPGGGYAKSMGEMARKLLV
ncbi:MAG: P-loop NTPase [Chitinispirillaceae bacterium]|jgi:flagellar biosynthesis protein FlhG|nr:P-loop NTPase [Chitinispirillaceae bacterium]